MPDEPEDSERPRNEAWWESELHRNEKLMDKYMAILGDNPDWDKWENPDDLYNKVHFNIDPPERGGEFAKGSGAEEVEDTKAEDEPKRFIDDDQFLKEMNETAESALEDPDWEDPDEDPEVNLDYEAISTQARKFACRVFDLEKMPGNAELLFLSAGKVGANLAGGHGLGYDEDTLCGNIVKCRWALSDCEFCREMLEQLHQKTGEQVYVDLVEESRQLAETLRERIARLRQRVWW
jgi:hypothetical protein